MKHLFLTFFVATFLLFFSSCFTIIEEITFNRDGSGTSKTVMDMSEMMGMLKMFMPDSLQDELNMDSIMASEMNEYKQMEGISNVKSYSEKAYVYTISYDFANVAVLNKAQNSGGGNEALGDMSNNYSLKGKKFKRTTSFAASDEMGEMGMDTEEMEGMMGMMNQPTYKVIYNMPKKVKKATIEGTESTWEKDNKTVSIEYNFLDFVKGEGEVMNHCIKF